LPANTPLPRRGSGPLATRHRRPGLTPTLLRGYQQRVRDFDVELVDVVGHWFAEQRPDILLDRLRAFLTRI
jgi:pimeloyl-ACP methyl ester carboxylesterase